MSRRGRLAVVLALNLVLVAGLVVAGLAAHSVGVLAAGGDYLADAAAIGLSLLAITLAGRPPAARRREYPRATAYAALVNLTLLIAVAGFVMTEAIRRLATGTGRVHGLPVLVASGVAAVVMLGGGLLLRADSPQAGDTAGDVANMRAVVLDTLADSAAAAGVAVTGAIITLAPGLSWLDPVVALVIGVVIAWQALLLVREVTGALHQPASHPDGRSP